MMLYAPGVSGKTAEPVAGITRLNKLLFLLEKEGSAKTDFDFKPYKMGPYSPNINPVIEFLSTFPSPKDPIIELKSARVKSGTNAEQTRYINDLASSDDIPEELDKYNSSSFELTEKGKKLAEAVWNDAPDATKVSVANIKSKYTSLTLNQLLRYVYSTYPKMTEKSEIKNQVFGKHA